MRTESLETLEQDIRRVVAELRSDKTALIVDDHGVPAAYLVDPQTYEAAVERLRLLEALASAERDIAEGRTLTHAQVREKMARWQR